MQPDWTSRGHLMLIPSIFNLVKVAIDQLNSFRDSERCDILVGRVDHYLPLCESVEQFRYFSLRSVIYPSEYLVKDEYICLRE
jgi:hypothetical protein